MWSVFGSIEDAFNNIWEVKNTRSWSRKISDYITIIVFAPILWVGASAASVYLQQLLGWADNLWLQALSKLISMAIAWFMFSLIYTVLPNTKVNLSAAIKSGFIAGTVFMLFQWGYVFVQTWMTSYNAIYGSFAALPLFLLWMLISWSILLLGGELSFTFQNEKRFDEERESLLVSYDCRRKLMVGVMVIVSRTFRDGKGAMAVDDIRAELSIPKRILSSILITLVEAGMLHEIHVGGKEFELSYAPARDISTLTVYDILTAVDVHGEGRDSIDVSEPQELFRAAQVVEKLKDFTSKSAANCKIMDLL